MVDDNRPVVQSIVIRDAVDSSIVAAPRFNNFATNQTHHPHSQMSRQRDGLVEDGDRSSRSRSGLGGEGSAQKSFRIRKYSRSLSRSSRASLQSSDEPNMNSGRADESPMRTIEIDNIRPNVDIQPKKSQNTQHQQFKSALPTTGAA
jgi:hypothetical protein